MLRIIGSVFFICLLVYLPYTLFRSKTIQPTFTDHLKQITQEVNNNTSLNWKAEFNPRFEGYSKEGITQFLGSKERSAVHKEELQQKNLRNLKKWSDYAEVDVSHLLLPIKSLPTNFDVREKWPKCKTLFDVRDQSRCGSCWAVSSAVIMSARLCIASKDQKDQRYVSAVDVLSCCKHCEVDSVGGCDGGYEDLAFKNWVDRGFVTGGNYDPFPENHSTTCKPYPFPLCAHHTAGQIGVPDCHAEQPWFKSPKCETKCVSNYNKSYWDDITRGRVWYSIQGEADMMRDVYTNGPMSVAIDLWSDLFNYKSGVYSHTTGVSCGGHAVNLFGWGEENGEKYWLIQNEWNSLWGDNGYTKIKRGVNMIGIENDASAGLAAFEVEVVNKMPTVVVDDDKSSVEKPGFAMKMDLGVGEDEVMVLEKGISK